MSKNPKDSFSEKFKSEVHWLVWVLLLGVGLTAYAHTNFSTKAEQKEDFKTLKETHKEDVKDLKIILKTINNRLYDLHKSKFPEKH